MTSADAAIDQLHEQYLQLLNDEATLLGSDSPLIPEQKMMYATSVTIAWNNYITAQIGLLNQDQATIDHISSLAQGAQQTLDGALQDLTTLATRINLVTSALQSVSTALTVLHL